MSTEVDRRRFLQYSAAAGAGVAATALFGSVAPAAGAAPPKAAVTSADDSPWTEATIAEMQTAMALGDATAVSITRDHIARIERMDWAGPRVNSIIEVNPDAEAIARELDRERAEGRVRGPLHGIPIVLKDVIATDDGMETTAGSLALVGSKVPRDAGIVTRLREAGAIVLGKANLSEWNAFRGFPNCAGWSGRVGVGRNPYDLNFNTGDSSSGSAAAVAASFAAGSVGLETYGSIIMPSSLCGVVGLKPTSGLIGRSGTIPVSFTRDVLGPMARSVTDLATLLGGMAGPDPLDQVTASATGHIPPDYTAFLDPNGLRGARIGVWRREDLWSKGGQTAGDVIESVLPVFRELGAELIDPVDLPNWLRATGHHVSVLFAEFESGIDRYLSQLGNTEVRTLADVVAFNKEHHRDELRWHNQALLSGCVGSEPLPNPDYRRSLRRSKTIAQKDFHDVMRRHRLDAIVAPTFVRAWPINLRDGDIYAGNGVAGPSNAAGYPNLTVPAGFADGLPIGISFLGRAWHEPRLLRYGYAFEQAVQARRAPTYVDTGALFVDR